MRSKYYRHFCITYFLVSCCFINLLIIGDQASNYSLDRGRNIIFPPPPFETDCKIYKYLICIAAFELRMSAASCISFALFTSASAEMILAFANLSVFEVIERSFWRPGSMCISLMKICSTKIPE